MASQLSIQFVLVPVTFFELLTFLRFPIKIGTYWQQHRLLFQAILLAKKFSHLTLTLNFVHGTLATWLSSSLWRLIDSESKEKFEDRLKFFLGALSSVGSPRSCERCFLSQVSSTLLIKLSTTRWSVDGWVFNTISGNTTRTYSWLHQKLWHFSAWLRQDFSSLRPFLFVLQFCRRWLVLVLNWLVSAGLAGGNGSLVDRLSFFSFFLHFIVLFFHFETSLFGRFLPSIYSSKKRIICCVDSQEGFQATGSFIVVVSITSRIIGLLFDGMDKMSRLQAGQNKNSTTRQKWKSSFCNLVGWHVGSVALIIGKLDW